MKQLTSQIEIDKKWMRLALRFARTAKARGEVPVGALIVENESQKILGWGYNKKEKLQTSLAHAEMIAIHRACKKINNWRLENCTLYVTLEPCVMCAGAILQSRIKRVVYGADDKKGGAVKSLYELLEDHRLNHWCLIENGIYADKSSEYLKSFFKHLRSIKKKSPFELN